VRYAALALVLLAGCRACSSEAPAPEAHDAAADAANDGATPEASVPAEAGAGTSFDDLPDAGPADLELRGKHLLQAISENDLSLAADIVLPREAYVTARDAQDPGGGYEPRFKAALSSQIARIRRREKGVDRAVFVSLDLGGAPARVEPRKREWKAPVWRVAHSKLTFTVDGRVRRVDVAEMIAWRGNWYVTKLRESRGGT
jgi:hypothetical protein